MPILQKYIWIWEFDKSDGGNIDKIIATAQQLGITGYILKTHDGAQIWQQASRIKDIKEAGLKCGAWGYCYGHNVSGEINAIKQTLAFKPDFYVMDVEAEFENINMRDNAEQLVSAVVGNGIPIGYTSFAIPSYHPMPFDVFSRYCEFTMPQIYWSYMGWSVQRAFNMSTQQYSQYKLPIYPIGQINSGVPVDEIQEFETLCSDANIPIVSYWNYQEAGIAQRNAIKVSDMTNGSKAMTIQDAVQLLNRKGIINSPDYWLNNAVPGGTVKGEFAAELIINAAEKIRTPGV